MKWGMQFLPISCQIPIFLDHMAEFLVFFLQLLMQSLQFQGKYELGAIETKGFSRKKHPEIKNPPMTGCPAAIDASICHWNMGWVSHISHEEVINWKTWTNFAGESTKTRKENGHYDHLRPSSLCCWWSLEDVARWSPVKSGEVRWSPVKWDTAEEGVAWFFIFWGYTVVIELDDGKIYRKALYLMVKTMVSCKFSLKPIQWYSLSIWKNDDTTIKNHGFSGIFSGNLDVFKFNNCVEGGTPHGRCFAMDLMHLENRNIRNRYYRLGRSICAANFSILFLETDPIIQWWKREVATSMVIHAIFVELMSIPLPKPHWIPRQGEARSVPELEMAYDLHEVQGFSPRGVDKWWSFIWFYRVWLGFMGCSWLKNME